MPPTPPADYAWVLIIWHKEGRGIWARRTEAACQKALTDWARDYWASEAMPSSTGVDDPSTLTDVAVCNDGTMWRRTEFSGAWEQIDPIPQTKVQPDA